MKLSFAAPESALPFLSIAFGSQASLAHFVMKLLSAAPASGLPSFPIALLRQLSSAAAAAIADPSVNTDTSTAKIIVLMHLSLKPFERARLSAIKPIFEGWHNIRVFLAMSGLLQ